MAHQRLHLGLHQRGHPLLGGGERAGAPRWSRTAGRVEAYGEQWDVEPDDPRQSPIDGVQYQEWNVAVHTVELLDRLDSPHVDHGLELGHGLSL